VTSVVPLLPRLISIFPLKVWTRTVAWVLAIAIAVFSVVPPSLRLQTGLPHAFEHFAIFWVTGAAFTLGYTLTPLLVIVLVVFSGAVEIVQLFIPGRHARVSDFIVDALACIIGLVTIAVLAQVQTRTRV
jgi:VanZ like family